MSEGTESGMTPVNESEVFATVNETQNEIQSQKLEHIRKWVHTQALNIPQSKVCIPPYFTRVHLVLFVY